MFPFEEQLAPRLHQLGRGLPRDDFRFVELIAATRGFVGHSAEVGGNQSEWFSVLPKPRQLRMTCVSSRLAGDDFLSEQTLPPQGDQSLGVEILRVNSPETHERRR